MNVPDSLRLWLRDTTFTTGDEIWSQACDFSGCARDLVNLCTDLRFNRKTRYSFTKLYTILSLPGSHKRGPFLRSLFAMYSAMRELCVPARRQQEDDALYNLTKEQ